MTTLEHNGRRYRIVPLIGEDGVPQKWADGSDVLSVVDDETGELEMQLTALHNPFSLKKFTDGIKEVLDRLCGPTPSKPPMNACSSRGANCKCDENCPMCSGEACLKCGAGLRTMHPDDPKCEHDVIERHEEP